jgi:general secretion pathway protein G
MSLVEVMVVIAIIVTLMGIVGYGALTVFASSRAETTKVTMGNIKQRVEMYAITKGKAPSTADGLKAAFSPDEVPKDSWGNDFVYVSPGPSGKAFDVVSYGADGREGGQDNDSDIKLSEL